MFIERMLVFHFYKRIAILIGFGRNRWIQKRVGTVYKNPDATLIKNHLNTAKVKWIEGDELFI